MVTALGPTPLGYGAGAYAPTPTLEAYAPGALGPTLLGYGAGAYAPTPTPEATTARAPHSRAARLVLQRVSQRSAYQR